MSNLIGNNVVLWQGSRYSSPESQKRQSWSGKKMTKKFWQLPGKVLRHFFLRCKNLKNNKICLCAFGGSVHRIEALGNLQMSRQTKQLSGSLVRERHRLIFLHRQTCSSGPLLYVKIFSNVGHVNIIYFPKFSSV